MAMRLLNWKIWTAGAALASALFGAAGYLGLPALARWGIETVGSRELGRALKVQDIRANPFLLKLTATGLTMADADPAAPPWLSIDAVTVDLSSASLWQRVDVCRSGAHLLILQQAPDQLGAWVLGLVVAGR